ncbi:hydroxymethylbilane synthase [candidate division KSB3 bacterium]|uniref:Porphobilinogen deaminase n=1 Tax=candidate division KSB3 bacterium TaxID=2044937 RepID=A0A9D5JZN0_9BACT|nr:hydroxymethylbilane synthase [candidate division KSB3 bacterium]MBD3326916.1 hydroxymethylbilane synthase [candidate division KSB3 bacterium]
MRSRFTSSNNYLTAMKSPSRALRAGSRGSTLALQQTQMVIDLLRAVYPALQIDLQIIKTTGDHIQHTPLAKIGGKGLFTKELEQALYARQIDFAVHSLKDLPVELPPNLGIAAYITRERPNDVLISPAHLSLKDLPKHATIATGSLRRKFQLLRYRADLQIVDVRGNLETRIAKLSKHGWNGLILAYAGLKRLGKTDLISEIIPEDILYPAVGQGIIAVECRDDPALHDLFAAINDPATETCALAERAYLRGLGGGCQIPAGIMSRVNGDTLHLSGIYLPDEGAHHLTHTLDWKVTQPEVAGSALADHILHAYKETKHDANG